MLNKVARIFRPILFLLVLISMVFGLITVAHAEELMEDRVPSGERIENDIILTGTDIVVDGDVDGDVIAIGRNIQINGSISGSLLILGRELSINNTVNGSVYSAGLNLSLGSSADLKQSLYFLGLRLQTDSDSSIERDLTVLSVSARLAGSIGRDLNTIIGLLDIISSFGRDRELDSNGPETRLEPQGNFKYIEYDLTKSSGYLAAPVSNTLLSNQNSTVPTTLQLEEEDLALPKWLIEAIETLITMLIFGLIALWVLPRFMKQTIGQLEKKPLPSTGYGLLGLVISANLMGVAILLAVIIGTVGFFLGAALLWELAWSFWALGFTSLSLIATVFVIFVLYISKVIVAYFAGDFILTRFFPAAARFRALSLLIGLLIYAILIVIPYLGWAAGILATAWGLGATWLVLLENRRKKSSQDIVEGDERNDAESKAVK